MDANKRQNKVGSRIFVWKVLSFSQCTRSCGGGTQIGKFRCVEESKGADREVSAVHCKGSAPPSRRRRCGYVPCPPKWRAAAWSLCPTCGPANRTRIVGCVEEHARGIIKVSFNFLHYPMNQKSFKINNIVVIIINLTFVIYNLLVTSLNKLLL